MTRISVVIPTYRSPELAIRAVEALCPVPDWGEVVLVDDASDDDTVERVRERAPQVQVVALAQNRGFGGATNAGFRAARGRFLATLNNDAVAGWGGFARLVEFLQDNPRAGAVAPALEDAEGRMQRVAFDFPRGMWGFLRRRGRGGSGFAGDGAPFRTEYTKGACVVFRRSALAEVGLFDEQFWMFAEELDLFRRLDRASWETWVLPEVSVLHEGGRSTRNHPDRTESSRFRQQSYRSICRYYAKHHSWPMATWLRTEMVVRVSARLFAELGRLVVGRGDAWWLREHGRCLRALVEPTASEPRERSLSEAADTTSGPPMTADPP